ncbi:MAG: MarR family winged helix-turn-helix transcriptional regulator [Lactobacillales bacterium]|jgi:DNA-binding MarR family transcriptional regulator|nr:MarR family winged helix-turn-helix transcriptional regulator [Lactobacillales bacterium]
MTQKTFFGLEWPNNSPAETAIYTLGALHNLMQHRLEKVILPHGIGLTAFNILLIVKHATDPKGTSQIAISRQLIMNPSNTTRIIDSLVQKKYITRKPSPQDRRVNLIKITLKGDALVEHAFKGHLELIEKLGGVLSKKELADFAKVAGNWLTKINV